MNRNEINTSVFSVTNVTSSILSQLEADGVHEIIRKNHAQYLPDVDMGTMSEFINFGSAKEYYTNAFNYVLYEYPYDGSLEEKERWYYSASLLEKYIFDDIYPKAVGYGVFSVSGYGTTIQTSSYNFVEPLAAKEYILFDKNIYASNSTNIIDGTSYNGGASNLVNGDRDYSYYLAANGNTVEFFLRREQGADSIGKEVVVDLWNTQDNSSEDYGRIVVGYEVLSGVPKVFSLYQQGVQTSTDFSYSSIIPELLDGNWHHYALSFYSSSENNNRGVKLYIDGQFFEDITIASGTITNDRAPYKLCISGLQVPLYGDSYSGDMLYSGKLSGSIDEVRFWNCTRSSREIGRNWFCSVNGGLDNEILGLYAKLNEGVFFYEPESTLATTALDYSGKSCHGTWTGYVSGSRVNSSAIDEYGFDFVETKDPIMYQDHAVVDIIKNKYIEDATLYDMQNTNYIGNNIPSWMLTYDSDNSGLLSLTLHLVGSYLDELWLYIRDLKSISNIKYKNNDLHYNSYAFKTLLSKGFILEPIMSELDLQELIESKTNERVFTEKLEKIKNALYCNINNNLIDIYKSKGTMSSFNSLLNSYGINEGVVNFNIYTDNDIKKIENRYNYISKPYRHLNLSENSNYGFISLPNNIVLPSNYEYGSITLEKLATTKLYHELDFGEKSYIFSLANILDDTITVYIQRNNTLSNDIEFCLSSSYYGITSSSVVKDFYDNSAWGMALRVYSQAFGDYPHAIDNYIIDFYGYKNIIDSDDEIIQLTQGGSDNFLSGTSEMSIEIGKNESTLLYDIQEVGFWLDYLEDAEIKRHRFSNNVLSRDNFAANAYSKLNAAKINGVNVPKIDTNIIHWTFNELGDIDGAGFGTIPNRAYLDTKYSFIPSGTYDGLINNAIINKSSTDLKRIHTLNLCDLNLPEYIGADSMIDTVEADYEVFEKNSNTTNFIMGIEKSLYHSISKEISSFFGAIVDYNNLIGYPVDKYRYEYKNLQEAKKIIMPKFESFMTFEEFFNFYKYIDDAILRSFENLIPASFSGKIVGNILESHILERNKYQHKASYINKKSQEKDKIISVNQAISATQNDLSARITALSGVNTYPESEPFDSLQSTGQVMNSPATGKSCRNVFIEKFSAPGDKKTEASFRSKLDGNRYFEYSPYNALPWRNHTARAAYNRTIINTEPKYYYSDANGMIPKNDINYWWIYLHYDKDDINYIDPKDGWYSNDIFGENELNFTSGFDFSSCPWYFIRRRDTNTVNNMHRNNIFSIYVSDENNSINKLSLPYDYDIMALGYKDKNNNFQHKSSITASYIEPPIDVKGVATIKVRSFEEDEETDYKIGIDNEKHFANIELDNNNSYIFMKNKKNNYKLFSDKFKSIKKDGKTKYYFSKISYKTRIYPKSSNLGLKRTRLRTNFYEVAGAETNGYDRDITIRRKMWDSDRPRRGRTKDVARNSFGFIDNRNSVWPLDDYSGSISGTALESRGIGGELHYINTQRIFDLPNLDGEFDPSTFYEGYFGSSSLTASALFCNPTRINIEPALEYGMRVGNLFAGENIPQLQYEDFSDDIKTIAMNMSLIPEFRISKHMPKYILEYNGNFTKKPLYEMFDIEGGYLGASSIDGNSYLEEFYKNCVFSDKSDKFNEVYRDNLKILDKENTTISVVCNAAKKFQPYLGFYPAQRTLQLTSLFSQSYAAHFTGRELQSADNTTATYLQSALQPYYAPGIMYNTIKAGLAVDWPAFTASQISTYIAGDEYVYACCLTNDNEAGGNDDYVVYDVGNTFNGFFGGSTTNSFLGMWFKTSKPEGTIINHGSRLQDNSKFDADGGFYLGLEQGKIRAQLQSNEAGGRTPTLIDLLVDFENNYNDDRWHLLCISYTQEGPLLNYYIDRKNVDDKIYFYNSSTWEFDDTANALSSTIEAEILYGTCKITSSISEVYSHTFDGIIDEMIYAFTADYAGLEENIVKWYNTGRFYGGQLLDLYDVGAATQVYLRFGDDQREDGTLVDSFQEIPGIIPLPPYDYRTGTLMGDTKIVISDAISPVARAITAPSNFRLPFESILSPTSYLPQNKEIYLSYNSWKLSGQEVQEPYFSWDGAYDSILYELAAHNYFAESAKWFNKDNTIRDFSSDVQHNFKPMKSGTTYYMDVVLEKTPDYFNCKSSKAISTGSFVDLTCNGRYFGEALSLKNTTPDCHDAYFTSSIGDLEYSSTLMIVDPAYCAFTPSYFYGKAIARLSYKAEKTGIHTLSEIQSGLQVEYINEELENSIADLIGEVPLKTQEYPAWYSAMDINASIQLFGKYLQHELTWRPSPEGASVSDIGAATSDRSVWSIYPRYECPLLDFSDIALDENSNYGPYGMWADYGLPTKDRQGVYFSIDESFKERKTSELTIYDNTGSLLDTCGFTPKQRKIGELPENYTIHEAVIAIPFVENNTNNEDTAKTIKKMGKYMFSIDNLVYKKAHDRVMNGETPITSIEKLVSYAQKYVLPPEFDFINNTSIRPVVMYFLEFSETFSQIDLCNIWQGVLPDAGKITKLDSDVFTHNLTANEFFHAKDLPSDIRWMIFKVKQRGEKNYFNLTKNILDNKDYMQIIKQTSGKKSDDLPIYSYNWPYDYCSLVEYIDIEFQIDIKNDKDKIFRTPKE